MQQLAGGGLRRYCCSAFQSVVSSTADLLKHPPGVPAIISRAGYRAYSRASQVSDRTLCHGLNHQSHAACYAGQHFYTREALRVQQRQAFSSFSAFTACATSHASLSPSNSPHKRWQGLPSHHSFHSSTATQARDHYDTLGVRKGASENEIKKAYYKLAKQYHPDANKDNPSASKKFAEVQQAYDILRDPQKRSVYDQVGHQQFHDNDGGGPSGGGGFGAGGFGGGGFGGFPGGSGSPFEQVLNDIAQDMFGGGGRSRGGGTMFSSFQTQVAISVTFMEALQGGTRELGIELGPPIGQRRISIDIPAGVQHGQQLMLENAVKAQHVSVNLIVQFQVAPHPSFRRNGDDILSKLPLRLSEAMLGCEKDVETAWGRRSVTVPPCTQSGARLAIDGAGAPRIGDRGRGRHICEVDMQVPRQLSRDQEELVRRLRDAGM